VGIPIVHRLRRDPRLAAHSLVWPFETGFTAPPVTPGRPLVLHAEVWPGVVERAVKDALARDGAIRDAVQVRELCAWAHEVDRSGRLASLLSTPAGLDDAERAACIGEEGWVLGAP
jgi:molybdopterin molybdotransferase